MFLSVYFVFQLQVCAAEGYNVQSHLLERLVGSCDGDIRKIIMHLQFWCQGKRFRKGQLHNTCACLHSIYMHAIIVYSVIFVAVMLLTNTLPLLLLNLHILIRVIVSPPSVKSKILLGSQGIQYTAMQLVLSELQSLCL